MVLMVYLVIRVIGVFLGILAPLDYKGREVGIKSYEY
jgi:hypothetical protein